MGNEEARRRAKHHRQGCLRLGTDTPKCNFCDETDPSCLELHHVAGVAFDDVTVVVCRNHHRKLSDMQKDHPRLVDTGEAPDLLEVVGRFLLGLADLLFHLIESLRKFGCALIERARCDVRL